VRTRRRRSRELVWAVVAMLACGGEETSTLAISVRVEPTVEVATAFPAEILVGFDSSGSGFVVFRLGFLCAPPSVPFVVTTRLAEPVTGGPSVVDAWLVPVGSATPRTCGALPAPELVAPPAPRPSGVRTSGQATILLGCTAGEVRSANLTLGR
jgi:hypothetical protein